MTIELYDQGDATVPSLPGRTPAYSSFRSFVTMLDSLAENGLPARMDRSVFGSASGGLIAQTRGTFRSFDLIDEQYKPTQELRQLVEGDPDERRAHLRRLAEEQYPDEIKLAEEGGTYGQLLAVLRDRGLTGATGRKAATFYVHMAEYTGLPVSPYFSQGRAASATTPTTRRTRRKKPVEAPTVVELPAPVREEPPAMSPAETQRAQYVDMLMELARKSGDDGREPSPDLLDRIERMLVGEGPKRTDGSECGGT